jgi:hypothetical protein
MASHHEGIVGTGVAVPQTMVSVVESRLGLHVSPSGTGPSVTTSVTTAGPTSVQVKSVVAAFGELNEPVGDDHAYLTRVGSGPLATAEIATALPTGICAALRVTELQVAHAKLVIVDASTAVAVPHASCTDTSVVARAATLNWAAPEQLTLLSVEVPESCTL